jgi:multicomponent K+:H+ antiporter subunit D
MTGAMLHQMIVLPVILPLLAAAAMLLVSERQRAAKNAIGIVTILAVLAVNVATLSEIVAAGRDGLPVTRAYLLGDWPAPFGIVLVVDRLSTLMLLLTSVLALAGLIYATARWERAGPRFHSLYLLQVMGLNGAFLTGDLFNLFVFFEVLLAASYGLLLHGSGAARVKAGLHYVAVNVFASLLFLIGTALIYGVTGTLNMADLAVRIPQVTGANLPLLQSGMGILGTAFLIKAGMWPLGFWLPRVYAAAAPPSAAIFAMLSKVGIYAVLRVYLLLFGGEAGWSSNFGEEWLLVGGLLTLLFGTVGVIAVRTLKGVAGFSVLVSSGSLLAVIGIGRGELLGGALFYLVSSTLAIGAFYLLIELLERSEADTTDTDNGEPVFDDEETEAIAVETETEVGTVIPGTVAVLGGAFALCALLLAGLPPLSGFIAKFAIMHRLLTLASETSLGTWLLIALLILSGLATLIATTRAGIDLIWSPDIPNPPLRIREASSVGLLLAVCLLLTLLAGPVMRYMESTSASLVDRQGYIRAVLEAPTIKPRSVS